MERPPHRGPNQLCWLAGNFYIWILRISTFSQGPRSYPGSTSGIDSKSRGSGAGWAGGAFAHPVFRKDHTYSLVRNMKSLVLPTQFSAASGFAHPVFSSFRRPCFTCTLNQCKLAYIILYWIISNSTISLDLNCRKQGKISIRPERAI